MNNVSTSTTLKRLQSQKAEAEAEVALASEEQRRATQKYQSARSRVQSIERQIRELTEQTAVPVVSEHAQLRFFERVLGYNLDEIKRHMLSDKALAAIRVIRSGVVPGTYEGRQFRLRVKDRVVTTLITDDKD